MYKKYAVVFWNANSKKVHMDVFMGKSESEARHAFNECYRHGDLRILSVAEIPE